jgi:hypothetical protein
MKYLKYAMAILFGLVIGSMSGLGYFYFVEKANFRVAYWKTSPIVVDCTWGSIKASRLESALDYWSELNHKVAFVEMNPSLYVCSQDHINGFIIIKNAVIDWPVMGETFRKRSIDQKINSALVTLSIGAANEPRLLEHELGHAFGYGHMDKEGHIMHSNYDLSGYDFWE